jgi:hypothetical protein
LGNYPFEALIVCSEEVSGDQSQILEVSRTNVLPLALGEAVKENGSIPRSVDDDHPIPAGSTLTWPRNSLLDDSAAKIGVDQSALGSFDGLKQIGVRNPLAPGEPSKPLRLKDSQIQPCFRSMNYSMQSQYGWKARSSSIHKSGCPIHRVFAVKFQDILYRSVSGHPFQV